MPLTRRAHGWSAWFWSTSRMEKNWLSRPEFVIMTLVIVWFASAAFYAVIVGS